jgi:hypothetical protein
MSENVGGSTSRNTKGLHGLYRENFNFNYMLYNITLKVMYYLKNNWAETGWIIMHPVRCQIKAKIEIIVIIMTIYIYIYR